MKFKSKCTCGRKATRKHRGIKLCEICYKDVKKDRKAKGVWKSYPIFSIGDFTVYIDRKVPFK